MPQAETAGNEFPALTFAGKTFHSIRNPKREAKRIVETQLQSSGAHERFHSDLPVYMFLLNPGYPYAAEVLRDHFPNSRIHLLYSDSNFYNLCLQSGRKNETISKLFATGDEVVLHDTAGDCQTWIQDVLPPMAFLSTLIIEWPAAVGHVANHKRLGTEVLEAIRLEQQNFTTRAFFSRRWLANYRANMSFKTSAQRLTGINKPVLLIASGPSLEEAIPWIQKNRHEFIITALPSSLRCLNANGIIADMAVSSDGGFWAGLHLMHLKAESRLFLATTAYMPKRLNSEHENTELFSMGMAFEKSCSTGLAHFPERGTVLYTALDILGSLKAPIVVLIGADMTTWGLQSHARPHSFDEIIESKSDRLHPLTTERFLRSLGNDLQVYSSWLKARGELNSWPPLLRYGRNVAELPIEQLYVLEELQERLKSYRKESTSPDLSFAPAPETGDASNNGRTPTLITDRIRKEASRDLFSNPSNSQLIEELAFIDSIALKDSYLQWLRTGNETDAVSSLLQTIKPQ